MPDNTESQKKLSMDDILFPEETAFFWWVYDDGSNSAIAVDTKRDTVLVQQHFDNAALRKEFQRKLKASSIRKNIDFEKSKLEVLSGLSQLKKHSSHLPPSVQPEKHFCELSRMLHSCGSDQSALHATTTLLSTLLAGYYARYAMTYAPNLSEPLKQLHLHAPIVAVTQRDGVFDALQKMVLSIIVDTSPKSSGTDELYCTSPPVLPTTLKDKHISDSAAIYLSCSKKKYHDTAPFPAQYRDTGVLINTAFYPGREVFDFQRRNPWSATVLIGAQQRNLLLDPIRLDGKIFSQCDFEWDPECVAQLMLHFAAWLARNLTPSEKKIARFRNRHQTVTQIVDRHNACRGTQKYRGIRRIWLTLQLLALNDLAQFLYENRAISLDELSNLKSEWFNALLPGCCTSPISHVPVEMRTSFIPEQDSQDLVEFALSKVLTTEHVRHFAFVPPKSNFPKTISGHEVWGYLRVCRSNNPRSYFQGLIIPEEQFFTLAEKYTHIKCNWSAVVKAFRKKKACYLHPTPNMRLADSIQTPALIFKLDDLRFLSDEILVQLNSIFPDEVSPHS